MKIYGTTLIIFIVLTCLMACGLQGSDKVPFRERVDLVFARGGKIYLMDTATGQTQFWAAGGYPRWSPNGQHIAFVNVYKNMEAFQIYVMNVDGTDKRVVSLWEHKGQLEPMPNTSCCPVWSPDGTQIAYQSCLNCELGGSNYEVFTIAIDTTRGLHKTRVTKNLYFDAIRDWSSDMKMLLIKSDARVDGSFDNYGNIYSINTNGSDKRLILESDSTFSVGGVRYSPDGQQITFIGGRNETNEFYIAKADGSNIKRITDNNLIERSVAWHPDGDKLGVIMGRASNLPYHKRPVQIYLMGLDGTILQKLTGKPGDYTSLDWRPSMD